MDINPNGWGQIGGQGSLPVTPMNLLLQLNQAAANLPPPHDGALFVPQPEPAPEGERLVEAAPAPQQAQAGIFSALVSLGRAICSQIASLMGSSSQAPAAVTPPMPLALLQVPVAPPTAFIQATPQPPNAPLAPHPSPYPPTASSIPGVMAYPPPPPMHFAAPAAPSSFPPQIFIQPGSSYPGPSFAAAPRGFSPPPSFNPSSGFVLHFNPSFQPSYYFGSHQGFGPQFYCPPKQFRFGVLLQSKYGQLAFSAAIINEPFPPHFHPPS